MIHARFDLAYPGFLLHTDIQLPMHGITALFGPSGSGKTTLLRCIAGLERAAGMLRIQGEVWQEGTNFLPVYRRRLGYVFQESNLFTHLSVRDNLEYGWRRTPAKQRNVKLEQVVEWLGLSEILDRSDTAGLSGGERQRVAIGRALLTSPRLLLMDEPLSALDYASKQDILPYLERLHRELDIPVVYVSHSLEEVTRLADHLVLLEQGGVIANGTLGNTLARLDLPIAHLDDASAVIDTRVAAHDEAYQLTRLDFNGGNLWVSKIERAAGESARVRVLARDVSIATMVPQGSSISNVLAASINAICDEGPEKVNVLLSIGDHTLLSRITRRSRDQLGLVQGMEVFAQVKSVALMA